MLAIKDKGVLIQIINRCTRIINKIKNIEYNEFVNNDDIKEVICFNLFQIGELASKLSFNFIEKDLFLWKQIIGIRHRIVHGYDTIDLEIVWNTTMYNILPLKNYCIEFINT